MRCFATTAVLRSIERFFPESVRNAAFQLRMGWYSVRAAVLRLVARFLLESVRNVVFQLWLGRYSVRTAVLRLVVRLLPESTHGNSVRLVVVCSRLGLCFATTVVLL